MVNIRLFNSQEGLPNVESLAQQLSDIASKNRNKGKSGWQDEEEDIDSLSWSENPPRKPYTKMEFPRFEGGNPKGWILKAEIFFCYYQTQEEHNVDIAMMYLEGDALDLFSWINRERTLLYWEELVKALQENYGAAEFQNPNEHLCNIQQTCSVHEYHQEFAKRSSRVTNWPDHYLLGLFLNGLKEELKSVVRIHKPRTVYRAMSTTRSNRVPNWTPNNRPTLQNPLNSFRNTQNNSSSANHNLRSSVSSNPAASQPLQTQTWDTERRNLMAQGLCFCCDEKFAPGHRCKSAKLSLMEITGEVRVEEVDKVNAVVGDNPHENDLAEISFHFVLGQSVCATMKFQGEINGKKVFILVDSVSTHNFVADSIVEEHNIPVEMVPTFGVQIGNGDTIRCNKVCRNLQIQLSGFTITQDYYPFAIGGADLFFGIKWLASLNTIQANWKDMFIIFNWQGKRYKLQGVRSTDSATTSL
ncbi:hypothetical protein KY285_010847 [Solanum tuberosum]|nr:hypothetical protein KY289_011420 [Solanum tuberosum]KAH0735140.1 hypothetical protein KY285_010847 [Solanum tuberosum]